MSSGSGFRVAGEAHVGPANLVERAMFDPTDPAGQSHHLAHNDDPHGTAAVRSASAVRTAPERHHGAMRRVVAVLAVVLLTSCSGGGAAEPTAHYSIATADSTGARSGTCSTTGGDDAVTVIALPDEDVAQPRCAIVRPDQRVRFVNKRDEQLSLRIGNSTVSLPPDTSTVSPAAARWLANGWYTIAFGTGGGGELGVVQPSTR